MFSRKEKADLSTLGETPKNFVPSIISRDLHIMGNLVGEGSIEIEGNIEGNIICHSATIRQYGLVLGDVVAEQVHIHGEIRGLVKARHVRISETGRVTGVVMYETLAIKDGAFIDGQCKNTDTTLKDREKATMKLAEDRNSPQQEALTLVGEEV